MLITTPLEAAQAANAKWCLEGAVFNVPIIPQLYDIEEVAQNITEANPTVVKKASIIEFGAFRGSRDSSPIIDVLLGKESDYAINQLRIGTMHKERSQRWLTGWPTYKVTPTGTILFTTKELRPAFPK